jgi:hypothetical protein
MQLADSVRNSVLDAIDDDLNGSGPEVRFFVSGGATPANEAAAILLNTPTAFDAASGGSMALDVSPALSDTTPAGHASAVTRLCFYASAAAADSAWLLQLGINPTGTPDVTMANNTIATTDTVQLTSLTLVCPTGTPDVT